MRRSLRRLGPVQLSRLAAGLLVLAFILAALGAWLRVGDGALNRPGLGYLLSAVALVVSVSGAALKARVAGLLVVFRSRQVRRNAVLSLVAGIALTMLGCVAASRAGDAQRAWQALSEGVLTFGIGVGLSGFLSLFWAFGIDYLGDRIEQRSEEDW